MMVRSRRQGIKLGVVRLDRVLGFRHPKLVWKGSAYTLPKPETRNPEP